MIPEISGHGTLSPKLTYDDCCSLFPHLGRLNLNPTPLQRDTLILTGSGVMFHCVCVSLCVCEFP